MNDSMMTANELDVDRINLVARAARIYARRPFALGHASCSFQPRTCFVVKGTALALSPRQQVCFRISFRILPPLKSPPSAESRAHAHTRYHVVE